MYAFVGQSIGLVGQKETYSSDLSDLASQTVCNIYDSKAFLHIFTLSIDHYRRWQCKEIMVTKLLKVVAQGEPVYVPSRKAEGGQLAKCMIRLKELGGEYEDEYICAMFGNLALCKFAVGKMVIASLRFQTHESNGSYFQDVVANDIQKI